MSLEDAISAERLSKYLTWADGDIAEALALYTLNVSHSEAFYTSLHALEITLRNAIHDRFSQLHGVDWLSDQSVVVDHYHRKKVAEAKAKFTPGTVGGPIVAELTFGFWTGLFGRKYNTIWGQQLMPIFDAGRPLQRKEIATRLMDVRRLRNRIAHHEPIIQYDLDLRYRETCELIGWLSKDALVWCNQNCRFPVVYPGVQIIVGNLKNPNLMV